MTAPEAFTTASKQPLTTGAVRQWPLFAHLRRLSGRLESGRVEVWRSDG